MNHKLFEYWISILVLANNYCPVKLHHLLKGFILPKALDRSDVGHVATKKS